MSTSLLGDFGPGSRARHRPRLRDLWRAADEGPSPPRPRKPSAALPGPDLSNGEQPSNTQRRAHAQVDLANVRAKPGLRMRRSGLGRSGAVLPMLGAWLPVAIRASRRCWSGHALAKVEPCSGRSCFGTDNSNLPVSESLGPAALRHARSGRSASGITTAYPRMCRIAIPTSIPD
jgi:hypothetical protein